MTTPDIVVYRSGSRWAAPWEEAFLAGLRAHGIDAEQRPQSDPRTSDLAVIWAHRRQDLFDRQRAAGAHYLVMERGYLGDRLHWTSLGFDGLNGRAVFPRATDGGKLPDDLWTDLLQPWRQDGEYVLVLGQVPGDAAIKGVNFPAWAAAAAARATAVTGRPARFRPHPAAPDAPVPGGLKVLEGSLADALKAAAAAVTYNSNSGVDAVLAGVPTWTMDRGSMAWPVGGHDPYEAPPRPSRLDWLADLAWCQWSEAEITAGLAWDRLRECVTWP